MKKRIAITGGRGRLAGVAASYFRERGHEVALFSRKVGGEFHSLNELLDSNVMSSFSTLLHAAWSTVPFSSQKDPGREEREDLPLLKNILETLQSLKYQVPIPKLIFLSSASVYGNQEKEPATEWSLCKPLGRYAQAKLCAERFILQAAAQDLRLRTIIFRMTNLIGIPSNDGIPQGILPKMVVAAKRHESLEIWGDGKASKDYLWIDDFLEALKVAIETSVQGVFNVSSGKNFSLLEFIQIIEEVTQQSLSIKYHSAYPWDVSCSKISSADFIKATGWKPQADIAKKIRELLK